MIKTLEDFIKYLGSLLIAILCIGIPVLLMCSIFLKWFFYISFLLVFITLLDIYFIYWCIKKVLNLE